MKIWILSFVFTSGISFASAETGATGPVPRVIALLKSIQGKLEQDAATEEDLYEKFICWGKSVMESKTSSTADAQPRVDSLKSYVADLDAGKVELTSERIDLEAEIKHNSQAIEVADNKRAQEHEDFLKAEEEMEQAIVALENAIATLAEATKTVKAKPTKKTDKAPKEPPNTLLTLKASVNTGTDTSFAEMVTEGATLHHAVEIADKFLKRGDALFLRRVLTGEVPEKDWKKLNRKATFKMSYKTRSTSIQDALKKLLGTFKSNLDEARKKESDQETVYSKLKGSMEGNLASNQDALTKMETEKGAKTLSKADAIAEISALEEQIKSDNKFMEQAQEAMDKKKAEYKERKKIRTGEIASIAEAIKILFSDEKRDLFKKVEARHVLLQLSQQTASQAKAVVLAKAMKIIAQAGRSAKDERLVSFAEKATPVLDSSPVDGKGTHFDEVIDAVDKMIQTLKDQEKSDLEKKETCEQKRMNLTRDAIVTSRKIDDTTDSMSTLTSEIQGIADDIKTISETMASSKAVMEDLVKVRAEEKAAYEAGLKDDQEAKAAVLEAKKVLSDYYAKIQEALLQKKKHGQAPEAPPPTWEGNYGGAQAEAKGVVAMLSILAADIQKDMDLAEADEKEAEEALAAAKKAYDNQFKSESAELERLTGAKGETEEKKGTHESERRLKFKELQTLYKSIDDSAVECDYFTINYDMRRENRLIEIDGLEKAKTILKGGRFTEPEDTTREMKPGDALIQRIRRHT